MRRIKTADPTDTPDPETAFANPVDPAAPEQILPARKPIGSNPQSMLESGFRERDVVDNHLLRVLAAISQGER